MNKMARKLGKITILFIAAILAVFVLFVGFIIVTDYKPENKVSLEVKNNKEIVIKKSGIVSIITYNIGYGGMDKYQDFFMDGGKGSRSSSREKTLENIEGVRAFAKLENPDIILFQEVDKKATRSFSVNEVDYLSERLQGYSSAYAINYRVPWVPVPINKPLGAVQSGLLTLSKYKINSATRYQYPGTEPFLKQLFDLDRCYLETRLAVDNGKELIIINTHLSAFDKGGEIRKQQLAILKSHIKKEYSKGNYVIVGGDWNHNLPGTNPSSFVAVQEVPEWLQTIPEDFTPKGFKWGIDSLNPTNRTVDIPYRVGVNYLSIIDGFLVSPNVEITKVEGANCNFEFSDHNPVKLLISLN